MICCDKCEAWQHNRCLNLPESDEYWNKRQYFCEQCKPEDHAELLAAMARGEKPWNRKKGQKPPKSRPSDVKAETKQEKAKVPTPPAQLPAPSAPAPAPSAAQAPPAPSPAPKDAQQEVTNGQAEAKVIYSAFFAFDYTDLLQPSKKESPKSQPQSPLGEKRRHESVAEKDSSTKKRRKSSAQHQAKAAPQSAVAADISALPHKQRAVAEKLRDTIVPMINSATDSRGYRVPDGETAKSIATRLALQIDRAATEHHGEPAGPDSPFLQHMRSIIFNVKKNAILVDRLLSGSLTPQEFASMAPEEMASEEKQREYAALREAAEKQMVLTEESGPRLRKTHKGEEVVGEEDNAPIDEEFRPPPPRDRDSVSDEKVPPQSPRDEQMTVELPEDMGKERRAPLSIDTADAQADGVRRPSTTFDINLVYDKVRSPQNDQQAFLQRRQSSIRVQEKPSQGPGFDADVDRLLKDEDMDVEMSGYSADPTIVWQGTISMQSLEPFDAVARFVAGGDFGQVVPWDKLLTPTLPIQGRIEKSKGDEYIRGLASSGTHDVGVLALSPVSPEGREVMDTLYSYFQPRGRWGVVPVDKLGNEAMRDLYVIPIEPGPGNLPDFLDMLEYCTIETPRKEHMILLALIAKLPETKPQPPFEQYLPQDIAAAPVAPPANGPTNGPSPSPVNPHGPQYSPVGPSFPPSHNYGNPFGAPNNNGHAQQMPMPDAPPHHQPPKAVEIFGPFINVPVVQYCLTSTGSSMSETQMENLREIVEHVPEVRNDLTLLGRHMKEKEARARQAQP